MAFGYNAFSQFRKHITYNPIFYMTFYLFQKNIELVSVSPENRHVPTIQEIVHESGFSGTGGLCFQLNYFFKLLLQFLGYAVFAIAGTIGVTIGSHIMLVVKMSEDEMYLIDVGCGNPTSQLVPLHLLPFRTIAAGSYYYEIRKISEGQYARYQVGGGLFFGDYVSFIKNVKKTNAFYAINKKNPIFSQLIAFLGL